MLHTLLSSRSQVVIVLHHFRQNVQSVRGGQMLVTLVQKGCQLYSPMLPQNSLQSNLQTDIVLVQVRIKLLSPKHFCYLLKLVEIVSPFEKRLLIENLLNSPQTYHPCHHNAQWPNIEGIMVVLVGDKEFRTLEIPWTDSHIIIFFR